ncbi:hypothetical protein NQ314_006602 [Rhamnusium bicolor]|uniref:Pentatricopeptide repeat-containing protein n=1 Tax=Rhamnusium bicolor TaxID=1586634 RepID=A0AAV8Z0C4_9CUCU|nr:hypothetical protein NQ314_006602 [Rhamnusium bicolor]
MFRLRLFNYIVRRQFLYDNVLLQNSIKFKSISSAKFAQISKESSVTSKLIHDEIDEQPKLKDRGLTEHEFLVRLKDDPDRFGSTQEKEILDEGDIREEKYFTEQPSPSQKLRTKQYADMIKALIKQRKIKEALDVLEIKMIKEDRVKPENYIYNLLLGACGRVGYTKKAFMLYNQMKKRGPWLTTDGLTRATDLRQIMIEKGYEPNDTNYNAMIKAFGRCGDLPMAFMLVDEMRSKGFKIKDDTINFLLQACITDTEAGFRHALLVWRKLINRNIKPSLHTYNLMLRCIRDCGLGDVEVTQDVINKILSGNLKPNRDKSKLLKNPDGNSDEQLLSANNVRVNIDASNNAEDTLNVSEHSCETAIKNISKTELVTSNLKNVESMDLRPNLMAKVPHLGSIISLLEITKAEERLLLVGGCSGFLENMKQHECTPSIKTFTLLLDCVPSTEPVEKDLITAMKKLNVKPDIDFYNMLIKKKSMRFDYEGAKELSKSQERLFGIFKARYKTWLQEVEVDETEDAHPWQQYRQINEGGAKYKWKDSARFKPRHTSLFKVKTSMKKRY